MRTFSLEERDQIFDKVFNNMHHYYKNKNERSSDEATHEYELQKLFEPLLEHSYFKEQLLWSVIRETNPVDERKSLFFLIPPQERTRQLVKLYIRKPSEFANHVNTFSDFCESVNRPDSSFIVTTRPFEDTDQNIVIVNLQDTIEGYNFPEVCRLREDDQKAINWLKKNLDSLKSSQTTKTICNNLSDKMGIETINENDVAKLINQFFWVKLAYPEEWEMMIFFPGLIEKEVKSIPFIINLGFKKPIPLDEILFLKRLLLLFFTRESIDYFEAKAKEEEKRRYTEIERSNRLLSDFQHIFLQCAADSSGWAIDECENNVVKKLNNYIKHRGSYLKELSDFLTDAANSKRKPTFDKYRISDIIPPVQMFMYAFFISKRVEHGIAWKDANDKFIDLFNVLYHEHSDSVIKSIKMNEIKELDDRFSLILPNRIPVATILENLVHNSLINHNDNAEYVKNYIYVLEHNNCLILCIWDTGKGFDEISTNKIPEWREGKFDYPRGFGYWLINCIIRHISSSENTYIFDYCAFDPTNNVKKGLKFIENEIPIIILNKAKDYLELDRLSENRFRVVHFFCLEGGQIR